MSEIDRIDPTVWRLPVGLEKQARAGELAVECGVHVIHQRNDGTVGGQVSKINLGLLAPPVADVKPEEPAVIRQIRDNELRRARAFAEYFFVGRGIFADRVMIDPRTFSQALRKIELALVRRNLHTGISGARQMIDFLARFDIEDRHRDFVFPALPRAVD